MNMSETLTLFRRLPTRMSACVVASESELARLESQFPDEFRQMFTGIALTPTAELSAQSLAQANVLVIEVNPALPGSVGRLERARARYPDLAIIAAVENLDLSKVRTLMRIGIKDVVALPFNVEELLPVVIDLSTELTDASARLAPMLAVMHSSGGVGASTVVSHLAAAITAMNEDAQCCIVDLDLQFGEQAALFGVSPMAGLWDCLEARERLDWDIIDNALTKVRPRIDLLAAPHEIPPPEAIDADQLLRLLDLLRQRYDHVLLDFPADWSNAGLSAACACTEMLLIVDQSVRSISRASKTVALFDSVNVAPDDVHLVVNRAEKRLFQAIDVDDVGKTLRRKIVGTIPLVKSGLQEAQVRGILLSEEEPRSAFSKAFEHLAEAVALPEGEQP
ncbi:MAG: AAA family ATPase [Erythrobacter sp.]|nr:AAA family ATPase [Erythrobacter sp.]